METDGSLGPQEVVMEVCRLFFSFMRDDDDIVDHHHLQGSHPAASETSTELDTLCRGGGSSQVPPADGMATA